MASSRPPQTAAALSPAEMELKFMWQEAELEFSQLTRRSLRTDREKRLEDVLAELDRKYRPPDDGDKDSGAKAKAKIRTTIGQVLSCIQLLGGLAAQGASIVFGPATLCFNAISFLIDIPGRVASVYEGVGNLFEEISHFLVLFKIYENYTTLDPSLRDGTHKLMMSMVRICGVSIKIIEGGVLHKIKIGAKVTFLNDDSGVRAELINFKALIDKQSHVTEAVTLQHVLSSESKIVEVLNAQYLTAEKLTNLEGGMNIVVEDVNDRKNQMIFSKQVEQIEKMLSMTREPAEDARKSMQKLRDSLLAGSGQWLLDHEDYKEWKATEAQAIPLLLLSGDVKTGKSSLLAVVEEDLRKTIPDAAIAFYEFVGRDGKGSKDKNEELVLALKAMCLQIAGQYKPYAKELASQKDDFKPPEVGKEKDTAENLWWGKLRFSSQTKEDAKFILIFDGLEELSDSNRTRFLKFLKTTTARSSPKAVRQHIYIIATGTPKVFENFSLTTTNMSDGNTSDIKLYIEEELRNTEVLQGQHVEMRDLLKDIRTKLPEKAQGSFAIVQQKLERIKEAVDSDAYLDDVGTILEEDPAEDSGKLARKILSDLNAILNAHEIEQLNKLLHWCVFGFGSFSVDELRATAFLSSGKSSLQPFERKLKKKYAKVLKIDGDRVWVDPEVDGLFRSQGSSASKNEPDADLENAKITMTVSINQADSRTVQQFFWDLTERVGIGRFDFVSKSNIDGKGVIWTESLRAHHHIVDQLLKLLNDEAHEKTNCLVSYALRELPWHLQELYRNLDEGMLDASERRNITKSLVDLLSDAEGLERYWTSEKELSSDWLNPNEAGMVRKWLTDKKTVDVLQPKERRWVKLRMAESEGRGGFFKPITLMVARRWLRDREWQANSAYTWVYKYLELQNSKDDDVEKVAEEGAPEDVDDKPATASSVEAEPEPSGEEKILSAATWVQRQLLLEEVNLDALWYERIADTCSQNYELAAAKKYYEKAQELPGSHWTVDEGWAIAVKDMADAEEDTTKSKAMKGEASDRLEKLLENLRALSKAADAADGVREALGRNLKRLAEWQEELKMVDRAFALYEEAVEIDRYDHATRGELLKALYNQKKEDAARDMLVKMLSQEGTPADQNLFSTMLRHLAEESWSFDLEPIHIILFLGFNNDDFNSQVIESLQAAVTQARRSNDPLMEGVLLLHQGVALARGTPDETHMQEAIRCWEDCQSLSLPSPYDLGRTRASAARFVAQHYFQQAMGQDGYPEERMQNFKQLLRVNRPTNLWLGGFEPTPYLASYYVQQGQVEEARKLFRGDMVAAFGILSDGDPDNDTSGYKTLANVLMHTGDDLNALSAWSLLGPDDVFNTKEQEAASNDSHNDKPLENGAPDAAHGNQLDDKELAQNGTSQVAINGSHSDKLLENGLPEAVAETNENDTPVKDGLPEVTVDNTANDSEDKNVAGEDDKKNDSTDRNGPLGYSCDGFCGHSWWYADDVYVCRYCPDTQFNKVCFDKLKANKLERYICHPEHSWLHVPKWSDEEALDVGKGKVRVGGKLVDGSRVGGDVVDIELWLDQIRQIWGIPKPEPVIELSLPVRRDT